MNLSHNNILHHFKTYFTTAKGYPKISKVNTSEAAAPLLYSPASGLNHKAEGTQCLLGPCTS